MMTYPNSAADIENSLQLTRKVLKQVLHSSSQGRGIGSLITYFELLEATSPREDGKILVDQDNFELIRQNATASREWLENLERSLQALTTEISCKTLAAGNLIREVEKVLEQRREEIKVRGHFVGAHFTGGEASVSANLQVFAQVVAEIFLNALKYSPEGSPVLLFTEISGRFFELRVENTIEPGFSGRDAEASEDAGLLKRPFTRLGNVIDDRYLLNYGLGLGLTISEYRMRLMGGSLDITQDKNSEQIAQKLHVRIRLPLV